MRKLLSFLTISFLLATHPGRTESYVFSTISTGATLRWNLTNPASPIVRNGRVVYNLNPAGSADVPFAQVESALADSFRAWEDLPNCTLGFTRGENRSETGGGNDGIFQIYWAENSTVDDGLDISGALGVTRLSILSGGGRDGEITDVSIVFNGTGNNLWAADGNPNRFDIAEVATHEIGHALGLSHSPIGAATMFPRTGTGSLRNRTLATDDQIGASVNYPASGYLASTGALRGVVRDQSGAPLFGANIVLTDTNGNAIASALSQRDGSYRIQGVPPGNYTTFVEPIDPPDGLFYGTGDLSSFYSSANTDFQPSADASVTLPGGSETARDFTVTRGNPAFNAQYVYHPARGGFTNVATAVERGQTVTVGVGGPGVPTAAVSLSISGSGITLTNLRAGTLSATAGNFIIGDAIINADAAPGARNLIVTANGQRSVIAGGLEIIGTAAATVSVVSAADFKTSLAQESIAAAFGVNLATGNATATTTPLPTTLGGTTVRLRDSLGNTLSAPLFFVSPTQINYQLPPGLQPGSITITITNGAGQVATGTLQLTTVAPGLFSMLGNGSGPAAATVLRVKPNGAQSFEPAVRLDTATNRFVTVPIDLSSTTDQVYLVLFGTGLRFRTALIGVGVTVGGLSQAVVFAGKQGGQVGLDQINVLLNRNGLAGRGEVDVSASVDGRSTNVVRVNLR
jgi:uncharacterized protein (TIGR03437 family)